MPGVYNVAGIQSWESHPETGSDHQFQCDVGNEVHQPRNSVSVEIIDILFLSVPGKTRMDEK
jgi:hypothetical protein